MKVLPCALRHRYHEIEYISLQFGDHGLRRIYFSLPCDAVSAHFRAQTICFANKSTFPTSISGPLPTTATAPVATTAGAPLKSHEEEVLSIANLESAAPAAGHLMATHDRPALPIEDEHEYGHCTTTPQGTLVADCALAMKHYRQTFPFPRTCLPARSRASPYDSDLAAVYLHLVLTSR
jgi:hypothetical protein